MVGSQQTLGVPGMDAIDAELAANLLWMAFTEASPARSVPAILPG